jgi:hypothetical protein
MKNVDDDRDEVSKEIDRLAKRGRCREAVLYALSQGRPRTASLIAQDYESNLSLRDMINICQVIYGLGTEDENPYPSPRMAQMLSSRWLITEEAHHQGVYLYPSEIEEHINDGRLAEAKVLADKLPPGRYQRQVLADIERRSSAAQAETA